MQQPEMMGGMGMQQPGMMGGMGMGGVRQPVPGIMGSGMNGMGGVSMGMGGPPPNRQHPSAGMSAHAPAPAPGGFCPQCGTPISAPFCGGCGKPTGVAAKRPAAPAAAAAPPRQQHQAGGYQQNPNPGMAGAPHEYANVTADMTASPFGPGGDMQSYGSTLLNAAGNPNANAANPMDAGSLMPNGTHTMFESQSAGHLLRIRGNDNVVSTTVDGSPRDHAASSARSRRQALSYRQRELSAPVASNLARRHYQRMRHCCKCVMSVIIYITTYSVSYQLEMHGCWGVVTASRHCASMAAIYTQPPFLSVRTILC